MTYIPLINLHGFIYMHLLQTGFMHNLKIIYKKTFKELHSILAYLSISEVLASK